MVSFIFGVKRNSEGARRLMGQGARGGIPNQCVIIVDEARSVYCSLLLVTTSSCVNKS
jgi:hypothetical protein